MHGRRGLRELRLPQTKIRPKHSEGVVEGVAENKGHFELSPLENPCIDCFVWPFL